WRWGSFFSVGAPGGPESRTFGRNEGSPARQGHSVRLATLRCSRSFVIAIAMSVCDEAIQSLAWGSELLRGGGLSSGRALRGPVGSQLTAENGYVRVSPLNSTPAESAPP